MCSVCSKSLFPLSIYQWVQRRESKIVELPEFRCAAVAREALRFIYTGEALIDASNAKTLVKIAEYLIIPRLKVRVTEYLKSSINAQNCLALESFASQFSCESLKEAAVAYTRENFVLVVKSDDFKALEFKKLKELISDDYITVSSEEQVFEAIVSWVKHDMTLRECLFPDLLKCLRLFSMSKFSLQQILKEELVVKSGACTTVLLERVNFFLFPDAYLGKSLKPRACLQNNESVVLLTGGHNGEDLAQQTSTSNAYCFLLSENRWLLLPQMPRPRTRHGAAVCGGQLYVVGGNSSDPMFSFNPKQNKWICGEEELSVRLHCSVTTVNEELYVMGGEDQWHRVDKYDPTLDEWKVIASMQIGRAAHCVVPIGNLIYVLGGYYDVCYKCVECFNTSTKQWTLKPSMFNSRRFAGATTSGGKIFIVGGYGDMTWETIQTSCEVFDPALNQWSLASSPVVPRAAFGIVSFDDNVYVFGGEDTDSKLDSVECYYTQTDKWEQISTLPEKLSCVQAAVLLLPKKYI